MQSTQVIALLSKSGKEDLEASLQWIKPIPDNTKELISKITIAIDIVKFSRSRCAEEGGKTSTQHSESLVRLKSEIESILNKI